MAVRQRLQNAVPVKLGSPALVGSSVEWHHQAYVTALVMVPGALFLFSQVVVGDLHTGDVFALTLEQGNDDWVDDGLHHKVHVAVQLWAVLSQNNLRDLAQLVFVVVGCERNFPDHMPDLLHQHFAELAPKDWHPINLREHLLTHFGRRRFGKTLEPLSVSVLRDQRNGLLHSLIQWLVDHPMTLH